MRRWILHEYLDRYAAGPASVGVYEDADAVVLAALRVKERHPRSIPVVFRENEPVEVLRAVRLDGETDALFQGIEVAHRWIEYRHSNTACRSIVLDELLDVLPKDFRAVAPKTVWEWLRQPFPYSFDDASLA